MTRSVAVLMGGVSSERAVSLVSGAAVAKALNAEGYSARTIDVGADVGALIAALTPRPDVVFNALHGRYGEDGCVQGLLELLHIPYTHSGVAASAVAMSKPLAKQIFREAGLPCAEHVITDRASAAAADVLPRPYVVKPANEGSSVGVQVIQQGDNGPVFDDANWPFGDAVMVERYIPGRELTVAVMGDRALTVTEIRPNDGFYDYRAKYTEGRAVHDVPANIDPAVAEHAMDVAVRAHAALGCRGVSRADFRYDDSRGEPGELILLEVNTQPGMTPLSLVPEQAAHCGIGFGALVRWMVEDARCDG